VAEDNLRTSATEFYNTSASIEQDSGLRMVLGPQTLTRQNTLSWVAIMNGIIAEDPRNITSYLAGPIDLMVVDSFAQRKASNDPITIRILNDETSEDLQELNDGRKTSLFYDDYQEFYYKVIDFPVAEMEDLSKIVEAIDTTKNLESEYRKLKESLNDFSPNIVVDRKTFVIRDWLLKTRLELLQKKEDTVDLKSEAKEERKNKQLEISKALPRFKLPLFKTVHDYVTWGIAVDGMLAKCADADETRICQMVKDSIVNRRDKKFIEAETDLRVVMSYMFSSYVENGDLIVSTLSRLTKLPDPDNLSQALYNSEEIYRTLQKLDTIGVLAKEESQYLMVLEIKAIDSEGRRSYLMAMRTLIETRRLDDRERSRAEDVVDEFLPPSPRRASTPRHERDVGARPRTSLIEDLNITAGVKEVLSTDTVEEAVRFFQDYLPTYIGTCRYTISQEKALSRVSFKKVRSPRTRRKVPETDPSSKILKTGEDLKKNPTRKPPLRKCPLGCKEEIPFGSVEFCQAFIQRNVSERRRIVQNKFLCRKCLKEEKNSRQG
jgi:hypothetical protein